VVAFHQTSTRWLSCPYQWMVGPEHQASSALNFIVVIIIIIIIIIQLSPGHHLLTSMRQRNHMCAVQPVMDVTPVTCIPWTANSSGPTTTEQPVMDVNMTDCATAGATCWCTLARVPHL